MRSLSAFAADSSIGQDIRIDERGNIAEAIGLEDIRQRVIESLRWQLGEWFLNTEGGVPYQSRIFSGATSVGLASSVITEAVLSERGVTAVTDVEADIEFSTRKMTYRARVHTDFGAFGVEETNG